MGGYAAEALLALTQSDRAEARDALQACLCPAATSEEDVDLRQLEDGARAPASGKNRRVDPRLDNAKVTYEDMCAMYRAQGQELSDAQLTEHWNNLEPVQEPKASEDVDLHHLVRMRFCTHTNRK